MTEEKRINDPLSIEGHSPATFEESDQDDIQLKNRTKRASSKQPKKSLKQSHSSPSLDEPTEQAQTITYETPQKAKTRAARKADDTFTEETPVPKAPRKVRRTARYVKIDAVQMNLARKFKEGI